MNERVEEWELHAIVREIVTWYEKHRRMLPWRMDQNPYHIWVSEIMLQQTRIEAVIPYYERFMKRLPTIQALAACDDEELHKLWEGLGYYSRVRNLKKGAIQICTEYGGSFPTDYEAIRKIPGIGDYTAGAIASMAFGQKKPAVDGNVLRVLTRIMACDQDIMDMKFRRSVATALEKVYPDGQESSLTQGLMELGEVICIPNGEPLCDGCPVRDYCQGAKLGIATKLPVKKPKAERRVEEKNVYRIIFQDKIAIRKRKNTGLLAGLWEYPNEAAGQERLTRALEQCKLPYLQPLLQKHIFTHVEWRMNCYELAGFTSEGQLQEFIECLGLAEDIVWVTQEELNQSYTLPTAFKKLW